jgi:hypothetical protein
MLSEHDGSNDAAFPPLQDPPPDPFAGFRLPFPSLELLTMIATPVWHQVCRRASTRVRFATTVRIESGGRSCEGNSVNVSLGGMMVACKNHGFHPLEHVLLTFEIEKGFFAELPAQIIHARSGEYFGVRWLDLPTEYAQILTRRTTMPAIEHRRSDRLAQRFFLELKWNDGSRERNEPAETVLISKHGCLLLARSDFSVGQHVQLEWREKRLSATARVAYSEPTLDGDLNKIALEFETANELWGQDFSN